MRAACPERGSLTGSTRDLFERGDDFGDGRRGDDLAIRARPQQRLEPRQVIGDLRPSSAVGPNGFARAATRSRMTSSGALSSTIASRRS
jgi:hypothetical protein